MKKFSTISKVKVDQEPKQENIEISELNQLKSKLHMIMDNYLSVGASGAIHKTLANGTLSVKGKEHVVEAILDMFEETGNKKTIKLLESMKNESRDHRLLDSKIENLMSENSKIEDSKLVNTKVRIQNLSERYTSDVDFEEVLSVKVKNMNKSLLDLLENIDIPHNRRTLIRSYIINEEAVKYDIEAAIVTIRSFNRNDSDDFQHLAREISKDLGYSTITQDNIQRASEHIMASSGGDRVPEDRTLVRELYPIFNNRLVNENDADESLSVIQWVEDNAPFTSNEDMIKKMIEGLGITSEKAKYWSGVVNDHDKN